MKGGETKAQAKSTDERLYLPSKSHYSHVSYRESEISDFQKQIENEREESREESEGSKQAKEAAKCFLRLPVSLRNRFSPQLII